MNTTRIQMRVAGVDAPAPLHHPFTQWKVTHDMLLRKATEIVRLTHAAGSHPTHVKVIAEVERNVLFMEWFLIDTARRTVTLLDTWSMESNGEMTPTSPYWQKLNSLSQEHATEHLSTVRMATTKGSVYGIRPTGDEVRLIALGGLAPDYSGRMKVVVDVEHFTAEGKPAVHYFTCTGDGGSVSNSMVAGKVLRTVALTAILRGEEIAKYDLR